MQRIDATSSEAQAADIAAGNLVKPKALFLEVLTDGTGGAAINVDALKGLGGGGVLMACLVTSMTGAEAKPLALSIMARHPQQASGGDTSGVFRDSALADDAAKSTWAAILDQHGIARVRSLKGGTTCSSHD